jgi:hypothetical protein
VGDVTLICAVATNEYVAISADRRLTFRGGGAVVKQIDAETKVAMLAGRILMGYAGVANLDTSRGRVAFWLADILGKVKPSEQLSTLRRELNRRWAQGGLSGEPHAFIGAGYDGLQPYVFYISNAMTGDGRFTPFDVRDTFTFRRIGASRGVQILTAGAEVERHDEEQLRDRLGRVTLLDEDGVTEIREALLEFSINTAETSGGSVGLQTMVATMPRSSLEAHRIVDDMGAPQNRKLRESNVTVRTYTPLSEIRRGVVPSFIPAMISRSLTTVGAEAHWGGSDFIGPTPTLAELAKGADGD